MVLQVSRREFIHGNASHLGVEKTSDAECTFVMFQPTLSDKKEKVYTVHYAMYYIDMNFVIYLVLL